MKIVLNIFKFLSLVALVPVIIILLPVGFLLLIMWTITEEMTVDYSKGQDE